MVNKMATRPNEKGDPRQSAVRPPAPYFGFQDLRFLVNRLIFNPQRARKEVLHFILPFVFEDPGRKRRNKKVTTKKLAIKDTKPTKITVKKPNVVAEKKEKPYKYKFKWKNQKTLSFAMGGFGILYRADVSVPNPEGRKVIYETCAVKYLIIKDGDNWFWNQVNAQDPMALTKAEALTELHVLQAIQGPGSDFVLQYVSHGYIRGRLLIAMEFCKYGDLARFLNELESILPKHSTVEGKVYDPLAKRNKKDGIACRFRIGHIRVLMCPIFDALKHMHSKGYIHKDIKLQNVLISDRGFPKLCDFGTAVYIGDRKMAPVDRDAVGSSYYMAPETVCREPFNTSLDTWQMGISMLVMLYGHGPYHFKKKNVVWHKSEVRSKYRKDYFCVSDWFKDLHQKGEYIEDMIAEKVHLHKRYFEGEDNLDYEHFRNFVLRCLVRGVARRPTATQLCENSYVKPVIEAWRNCVTQNIDPRKMFPEMNELLFGMDRALGFISKYQAQKILDAQYDAMYGGDDYDDDDF